MSQRSSGNVEDVDGIPLDDADAIDGAPLSDSEDLDGSFFLIQVLKDKLFNHFCRYPFGRCGTFEECSQTPN